MIAPAAPGPSGTPATRRRELEPGPTPVRPAGPPQEAEPQVRRPHGEQPVPHAPEAHEHAAPDPHTARQRQPRQESAQPPQDHERHPGQRALHEPQAAEPAASELRPPHRQDHVAPSQQPPEQSAQPEHTAQPQQPPEQSAQQPQSQQSAPQLQLPAEQTAPQPQQPPPGVAALAVALAERTADLQRLKAEYDNYRSRVHRDRLAVREVAVANVLRRLLPVLDAISEAARQGELTDGFQRVARALDSELAALGLAVFGAVGEPFDPRVHQAVSYHRSDHAERPVCTEIVRPGYRVGDHLLRPAEVTVTGPPATA
ncbi:nucleotide exchange factor GrpE [Streptomyces ficellus]|uniref:Protein GrpE n=2 Tax=Streptomyces ficellus TaxID=1977088 RepID=A0ABT7ZBB7_9ACTN|nr:nucleotide exchange factor GrpE [Streptomyces ficellus]MDN3296547.1 nucleotide exchange factor GrpE [Streptomyces ficellus]